MRNIFRKIMDFHGKTDEARQLILYSNNVLSRSEYELYVTLFPVSNGEKSSPEIWTYVVLAALQRIENIYCILTR